jgi:predicted membrane-bound spermidine synthase
MIVLVGLISGAELPLLMDIGRKIRQNISGKILATDYLGTLAGSVSFPIFIVPYLHLFTIGYLVAFLNTLAGTMILILYKQYKNLKYTFFCVALLLIYFLLMINSEAFNTWIINKFYYLNMGQ